MTRQLSPDQLFVKLVDQYLDRVYRFLCNFVRDPEAARDLSHETFLHLRRQVDSGKEISEAYVFTTARNTALSHWRQNKREYAKREALSQEQNSASDTASSSAENNELRRALQTALEQLPEQQRSVFLLSEVEGLKYEQIARILDISPGTVASRKFNATRTMRIQLKRMGHEL